MVQGTIRQVKAGHMPTRTAADERKRYETVAAEILSIQEIEVGCVVRKDAYLAVTSGSELNGGLYSSSNTQRGT